MQVYWFSFRNFSFSEYLKKVGADPEKSMVESVNQELNSLWKDRIMYSDLKNQIELEHNKGLH